MTKRIGLFLCLSTAAAAARAGGDWVAVEIIDRRDSASTYLYVIPGQSQSTTTANATCATNGTFGSTYTNCTGNATTNGYSTPGFTGEYQVTGATFSLRVADGRIAVVNCERKVNWTEWTPQWYRSCRAPIVNKIEAEFSGGKAKLRWPVSMDGKKFESETYKILGVLPAPAQAPVPPIPMPTPAQSPAVAPAPEAKPL